MNIKNIYVRMDKSNHRLKYTLALSRYLKEMNIDHSFNNMRIGISVFGLNIHYVAKEEIKGLTAYGCIGFDDEDTAYLMRGQENNCQGYDSVQEYLYKGDIKK